MWKLAAALLTIMVPLAAAQAARHAHHARHKQQAAAFRTAIQGELGDSDASFESLRMRNNAVCGSVEAKNKMGFKTAKMLFVYVRSQRKGYVLGGNLDSTSENVAIAVYQQHCQE